MTKKEIALQKNDQQMLVFKALADPIRIEIITYLKKQQRAVTCGEVGQAVNISKTAGSYHFKLLQAAGLITAKKISREKYVALDATTFDQYVTNFYDSL